MHIEPGYLAPAKILAANLAASGLLAGFAPRWLPHPALLLRTALAATFFSLLMQAYHVPVGPSELHFVGAMAIYLTLGFLPTLYGFALGLLVQGLLFEPADLVHLGVNSLSLIVPLIAVHAGLGRRLLSGERRLSWARIVTLDATYYAGVTLMVGLWLSIGEVTTPLAAWARFAASYLVLVACEPLFTWTTIRLLKGHEGRAAVALCTDVALLRVRAGD